MSTHETTVALVFDSVEHEHGDHYEARCSCGWSTRESWETAAKREAAAHAAYYDHGLIVDRDPLACRVRWHGEGCEVITYSDGSRAHSWDVERSQPNA